jgi:hypothetical protein
MYVLSYEDRIMAQLRAQLDLDRCPHCGVDRPSLTQVGQFETNNVARDNPRWWRVYLCSRCGGLVTAASAFQLGELVTELYPSVRDVDAAVPERARAYLRQALDSLSAPVGAVMLAASAVDAMLKAKGYVDGSLYTRIDKAAADHLITRDMAEWAHDVRLDANDQRHADEQAALPQAKDAERCIDFSMALAQFLFVLPSRIQRGIQAAKGTGAKK